MSRHNRRQKSKPDRRQELVAFGSEHNPLPILRGYLHGKLDHDRAIKRLGRSGARGLLWGGEVALGHAHRISSPDRALEYIDTAKNMLQSANQLSLDMRRGRSDYVSSRSDIRIAHLPVHAFMILEKKLPPKNMAAATYMDTVEAGKRLVDDHKSERDEKNKKEMTGLIGELSVLLLAERFTLATDATDIWFPLLAHIREDRRNTPGSSINHGWDMSVFTDIGDGPTLAHRTQIKNGGEVRGIFADNEEGMSLVVVSQDLKLSKSESFVGAHMLRDLHAETLSSAACISSSLDRRQEKLIDIIDPQ